jgi:uncharacterized protein
MRNLILTGGIRHDFADNADALRSQLSAVGIASELWDDIDAGIERLSTGDFDLVTVMALRWPMEGDAKYEPYRAEWSYRMPRRSAEAMTQFVAGGGGLFGLHTASLCFDDWAGWRDLLGGTWRWGQSFHPKRGAVSIQLTLEPHDITAGLSEFIIEDEIFSDLDLAPETVPLMQATPLKAKGDRAQPVLWAKAIGRGRSVYNALGHDRASLEHPIHHRLLQRCALWAGGADTETLSNI